MIHNSTYASTEIKQDAIDLDELSGSLRVSKQTLVRWVDRGLIDAELGWGVGSQNEEQRLIRLSESTLDFLRSFSEEYRESAVSRTEARRLLKLVDRNQVQRLIRQGEIASRREEGETRVVVGSVEDYLCGLESEPESQA